MSQLSRSFPLALTLALGLGVIGCAVPLTPLAESPVRKPIGSAGLTLVLRVAEGMLTQAVVTRPTAANIHRLVVIPMVETSQGQYQPFTANGTPTALGDAQAVSFSRTSPNLNVSKTLQLTGLAPNTKYRILARAYDAHEKLLSKDAESTVDVTVTNDDDLTSAVIPVKLADVPFAAKTAISLVNGPKPDYASVETSLVTVSGGTETPVPGTTQTLTKAQMPMVLTLDGLRADTTYRLNASLRDGTSAEVATASAEIAVSNDDAPTGKTLTLNVASNGPLQIVTFTGAYPTAASGVVNSTGTLARFNNPSGLAIDASNNLYVSDRDNRAIRKVQ